jgi:hypothetical protein
MTKKECFGYMADAHAPCTSCDMHDFDKCFELTLKNLTIESQELKRQIAKKVLEFRTAKL